MQMRKRRSAKRERRRIRTRVVKHRISLIVDMHRHMQMLLPLEATPQLEP